MSDIGPVIGFTDSETGEFFLAEKLLSDAERWQYVRDNLVMVEECMSDGSCAFMFSSPAGRGRTIDEVIDKLRNAL